MTPGMALKLWGKMQAEKRGWSEVDFDDVQVYFSVTEGYDYSACSCCPGSEYKNVEISITTSSFYPYSKSNIYDELQVSVTINCEYDFDLNDFLEEVWEAAGLL